MDGNGSGFSGKQVEGDDQSCVYAGKGEQALQASWFKKLDGEGDSATGTQLICGIISCAEHRNNFCNAGALVDSHKMKAALKVQFTFTLGLNEILTGVETEESPTREVGAAVSFTTTDCYCQFNELKALRFQSNCKGRQHEMVGIVGEVATLLMGV